MARVTSLRHVDVAVPDFEECVDFYSGVWGLKRVDGEKDVAFLAAEGSDEQFVYRVRQADEGRLDLIAFGAESHEDVDELAAGLAGAGVRFVSEPDRMQTPGGGYGFRFFDPDGRVVEISAGVEKREPREIAPREGIPVAINHVVVNSPNRKAIEAFYAERLGFKLSDWIAFMGFYRCNANHHSLAIADGEAATLNHVAFEVRSIDDMMRGSGRVLKDGRARIMMGPGRHSAGDNTFYYFFDSQGNVSEYTAEVEQVVDENAWTPREHPPIDMWGTAQMPGRPPGPSAPPRPSQAGDLPPARPRQSAAGLWVAPPI
ncbi:MAG TPA: VOC family protein [Dehalococcoidia bacterium]|nr:VOC family protein [Dehalococcoidia bacterium]